MSAEPLPWHPAVGDQAVALELLDRALAYTRGALASVDEAHLGAPTPCRAWPLGALLAHMEDALDAFGEGADGVVGLRMSLPAAARVTTLQRKACALHGRWSSAPRGVVDVGGLPLDVAQVARAAALEIAVHGWDVAQATGAGTALPGPLAHELLPVAARLVTDADRPVRFAAPRPAPAGAPAAVRLLAWLGRTA